MERPLLHHLIIKKNKRRSHYTYYWIEMSVLLLQHGRALPVTWFFEQTSNQNSEFELRSEAAILTKEVKSIKQPNGWHAKKALRLIEIGILLHDVTLESEGNAFLTRLCAKQANK